MTDMLNITIICACTGKNKESYYTEAAAEYTKRISAYAKIKVVEVEENSDPDEFGKMDRLEEITGVTMPENLRTVRHKKELHTAVIAKEEMLQKVLYL